MVLFSHPYMTTGKTIALTLWTIVGKLSMFVIGFLPRSKHLLISRHKIRLNELKRTENISSIFSEHNYMKGKNNHRKRKEKKITWRLNNMLLTTHRVNDEIKEEV